MRIAICNVNGASVSGSGTCTSGEMEGIANILNSIEPHCCKLMSFKEEDCVGSLFDEPDIDYICTADPHNYDAILVMNSNCNFFGGRPNLKIIEAYKFLARSKTTPIFLLHDDTGIKFSQCWDNVKNRDWNEWTEDELLVTAPVYCITQFKDTEMSRKLNKDFNFKDVFFCDFGTWILDSNYKSKFKSNSGKYDLTYGGNARKARLKSINRLLGNVNNLNVLIYGSLGKDNITTEHNNFVYEGKLPMNKVVEKNTESFSTIIVGEKGYNNNFVSLRIYEAILAGCIVFVDNEFDENHRLFSDYLYVNSSEELEAKVLELRSNTDLANKYREEQINFLERQFNSKDHARNIYSIVKENI